MGAIGTLEFAFYYKVRIGVLFQIGRKDADLIQNRQIKVAKRPKRGRKFEILG
jgi:hypothetical protein